MAAGSVALPAGFELEPTAAPAGLPPGFELQQSPGLGKAAEYGLASGPGGPGDLRSSLVGQMPQGIQDAMNNLGQLGRTAISASMAAIPGVGPGLSALSLAPTSAQTRGAYSSVTGRDLPPPQSPAEKTVAGGAEGLTNPLSYTGVGSLALKALGGAASGAAGEIGENVAGTPGRIAGSLAGGAAASRTFGPRAVEAAVPTQAELAARERTLYKDYRNSGVEYHPQGLAQFGAAAEQHLTNSPEYAFTGGRDGTAPKTMALVERLQSMPPDATVTAANLDTIRRQINDIASETQFTTSGPRPTSDAAAAMALKRPFAQYLENPPPGHVVAGDPQAASAILREANQTHGALSDLRTVDVRLSKAEHAADRNVHGSEANQIRSKVGALLDNPQVMRNLKPDERAQVDLINGGDLGGNFLRQFGRGGAAHVIPIMGQLGAAAKTGGLSLPVWAGMIGARLGDNALTKSRAKSLAEMIAMRSPLGLQRKAALPQIDAKGPIRDQLIRSAILGLQ